MILLQAIDVERHLTRTLANKTIGQSHMAGSGKIERFQRSFVGGKAMESPIGVQSSILSSHIRLRKRRANRLPY